MKIVSRKVWVSVLLLMISSLAMTPTSLLTAIYADTVEQVSTCSQMPGMANGPCLTTIGQTGIATDWATISVSLNPPTPTVGQQVTINTVIVALSSPGTFPQNVEVGCFVDSTLVGGGMVTYPGPIGTPLTVPIPIPWTAVLGSHKLTCGVATIPAGLDPNKINNWNSITFNVGSVPVLTEITGAYTGGYTAPYPGFYTATSTSLHTTMIGVTMPSMNIFSYTITVTEAQRPYILVPGQPVGTYCASGVYGGPLCPVQIWTGPNCDPSFRCGSDFFTISVNFPSNEVPEPVTLTVSGLPPGATFNWGTELPASSLAPYTATPPYSVKLTVGTTQSTPSNTYQLFITSTSKDSFKQVIGPIYLQTGGGCTALGHQLMTATYVLYSITNTMCV